MAESLPEPGISPQPASMAVAAAHPQTTVVARATRRAELGWQTPISTPPISTRQAAPAGQPRRQSTIWLVCAGIGTGRLAVPDNA